VIFLLNKTSALTV